MIVQGPSLLWLTLERNVGPCFAEYVLSYSGQESMILDTVPASWLSTEMPAATQHSTDCWSDPLAVLMRKQNKTKKQSIVPHAMCSTWDAVLASYEQLNEGS